MTKEDNEELAHNVSSKAKKNQSKKSVKNKSTRSSDYMCPSPEYENSFHNISPNSDDEIIIADVKPNIELLAINDESNDCENTCRSPEYEDPFDNIPRNSDNDIIIDDVKPNIELLAIDDESNDCENTSRPEIKYKGYQEKTEKTVKSEKSNNHHRSTSENNVKSIPRMKSIQISPTELRVAKIVNNQKSSSPSLDRNDVLKLSTINISFKHEIPPQHNIERLAGTRVPTKREKEEIKKYVEIKKGPYDHKEDARIVHNWRKFCKKYKWDKNITHPFLHVKRSGFFYISPVNERKKFVQALAKGLDNRTLYSVYHRFRNLYSKHKQERYKPEEDKILMASINNNLKNGEKPNYAILAKKLNRTRASIWRRYVLLLKKEDDSE